MAQRFLFSLILVALLFNSYSVQAQITKNAGIPRFQKHFVRERETPSSIAHDFNVSTKDFLMLNNFPADVKLRPGQEVLIKTLSEGESAPKESAYVPRKSAEEPVKTDVAVTEKSVSHSEPVAEKAESHNEPATEKTASKEEPVKEKTAPRDEEAITNPKPAEVKSTKKVSEVHEETVQPKKITTAPINAEPDLLVGPNGAKYEMTSGNFHVVQKGQTFYHIALMYHLTMDELKNINHLSTTDIKVGQELKVSK